MDRPTIRQLITLIQPTRTSVSGFIAGHICVPAGGGEDRVIDGRGSFQTEFREETQTAKVDRGAVGYRRGARTGARDGASARFKAEHRHPRGGRGGDYRLWQLGISVPDRLAACIFQRLSRRCEDHLRRQQHLRQLSSGGGGTLALVAAWARHAARDRGIGAGRFLRREL